jgi:Reverse transcriptase (RNA-dependent DNA polymerase)
VSLSLIAHLPCSRKASVDDYPTLKEDKYWHSFLQGVRSIAAMHGTSNVLSYSYVPSSSEETELFGYHQRFMFNVFKEKVLTSKGRVQVRRFESSLDAQKVFAALLDSYEDSLTTTLSATALRAELTTMRLDDSWKKSYESYLNLWSHKVLDLEKIENSAVPDATKRLWLTTTLQEHKDMKNAISQATTTEHTLIGMGAVPKGQQLDWERFYDMLIANAKLLDDSTKIVSRKQRHNNQHNVDTTRKQGRDGRNGRQNGRGRGNGRGNGGGNGHTNSNGGDRANNNSSRNNRSSSNVTYSAYTGPNMVMSEDTFFTTEDYRKLTRAQKDRLRELHQQRRARRGVSSATQAAASNVVVNAATQSSVSPTAPTVVTHVDSGSHLRQMLSQAHNRTSQSHTATTQVVDNTTPQQITYNGHTYTQMHAKLEYRVSQHNHSHSGSLIDGGANGGMSGNDVRVLSETMDRADVTGIANNKVSDLKLCTVAGLVQSSSGPVVAIFHQYAHYGEGRTIHSSNQLRSFGLEIDDTPRALQGKQRIRTPCGRIIPLSIRNGLPFMDMSPPTDNDIATFPHIMFTADLPWDPSSLDDEYGPEDELVDDEDTISDYHHDEVNDYGELMPEARSSNQTNRVAPRVVHPKQHDFVRLKPNFGFVPVDRIRHTIDNTTQFARADARLPLRRHFKTRFPAANVNRLNEVVATDTFFSDTPAHDDGILGHGGTTMVQLFCGVTSLLTAVFAMSSESQMPGTFEDFIRKYGAPKGLFSDNAKVQIGSAVKAILRLYAIADFQCEPHYQNQNPAERRIQDVKKLSNQLMDRTGTPEQYWLLCLYFVVYLLNRLATESLEWKTPLEKATGQVPDISPLLAFRWWEPVYYTVDNKFPSESPEKTGRWAGVAEHQGDALTYLVLTDDTLQVITRSVIRTALGNNQPNLRAEHPSPPENLIPDGGETVATKPILQSTNDIAGEHTSQSELKLPKFSPEELIGRTFIRDMDDGQKYRARVVQKILDKDAENHQNIKFLLQIGEGKFDEIITYNELNDIVERQIEEEMDPDKPWAFKTIKDHQGPLNSRHPDYKGSSYNVLIQWEDGSETFEPLDLIFKDDPVSLADYAESNNLLGIDGWKRLRRLAKNRKKLNRMLNQSKLKAKRHGPIYKFGVQVPRNIKEAYELDKKNGNTKWQDAVNEEITQLLDYVTFEDRGQVSFIQGYKRINCHFVFDVKHDLRHKARFVAGGHQTDVNKESNYSGVVSLRSMRICLLLGYLNGLDTAVGDVGNAYLEAYTKEKVYFVAGPEFGPLAGHSLIIVKALYGLRSSGARYHERFADTLRDMNFFPSKADPDVWMRDCGTHYEYMCVYVDDLLHISKDPAILFNELTSKYGYKLKGVGPPKYHLGGDYFRDDDGTQAWGAQTYIKKMLSNYERMFGTKPKEYSSPLEKGDHPEMDVTDELDDQGIAMYQSLIGALQWAVTLGRFDIQCAVATMSSFRTAPRQGHLDRLKRIYGYLKRKPDAAIRFRTGIPNHKAVYEPDVYDWLYSVYGNVSEDIPKDAPKPRGKPVQTTTYEDANLMHDLVTGRSMSGILHMINQTPVQWFAKKQNLVETATYGSEFMVARQATEQIIDLRYTLRMLGVPLEGPSWMFGDNKSVVTSSTIPHSTLDKRWNALSYHRVREAIAAGIIIFQHIDGKSNPSDVLTKFLPWNEFWPLIQPLLFWKGETMRSAKADTPLAEVIKWTMQESQS